MINILLSHGKAFEDHSQSFLNKHWSFLRHICFFYKSRRISLQSTAWAYDQWNEQKQILIYSLHLGFQY